jgi:hypothetical protein
MKNLSVVRGIVVKIDLGVVKTLFVTQLLQLLR